MSGRALMGAAVAVVGAAAIVTGLVMVGPPSEARRRALDERRVNDLRQLSAAIDAYWTRNGRLPDRLAALETTAERPAGYRSASPARPAPDPSTSVEYGYRVVDSGKYELCADFELAGGEPGAPTTRAFWAHGAGRQCFTLEARKAER
jgi:type II secretory pathway pseudopilin PulG